MAVQPGVVRALSTILLGVISCASSFLQVVRSPVGGGCVGVAVSPTFYLSASHCHEPSALQERGRKLGLTECRVPNDGGVFTPQDFRVCRTSRHMRHWSPLAEEVVEPGDRLIVASSDDRPVWTTTVLAVASVSIVDAPAGRFCPGESG
jgi:hypothetical protein